MKTSQHSPDGEARSSDLSSPPRAGAFLPTATTTAVAATAQRAADATFPQKLMDAVERETTLARGTRTPAGDRVLEWLPEGTAFVIRDRARFEREVLAKYFNKCKFMSFTRKLYRWGFRQGNKSSLGVQMFQHKHFVRGDGERCLKMRSLVKSQPTRPTPQAQHLAGYDDAVRHGPLPPGMLVGAVNGQDQCGMTMGHNNLVMGNTVTMATAHRPFPLQAAPPLAQMGGGNILPEARPSRLLLGGRNDLLDAGSLLGLVAGRAPAVLSAPSHHSSRGGTALTSAEMLVARLRLESLVQGRRQLVNLRGASTPSASLEPRWQQLADLRGAPPTAAPVFHLPAPRPSAGIAAPPAPYGAARYDRRPAAEVELAIAILRQGGAGMAPWRELQLAEQFRRH